MAKDDEVIALKEELLQTWLDREEHLRAELVTVSEKLQKFQAETEEKGTKNWKGYIQAGRKPSNSISLSKIVKATSPDGFMQKEEEDQLHYLGLELLYEEVGSLDSLDWIWAVYCFDHGYPYLLYKHVTQTEPMPDFARVFLGLVVSGERKPNLKLSSQIKGDPMHRGLMLIKHIRFGKGLELIRKNRTNIAEELRLEAADVMQVAKNINSRERGLTMEALELKERQFDELLKEFRKRIKKFPEL